jgi:hypothetical protein
MKRFLVSSLFAVVPGLAFADVGSPAEDVPDATNLAMLGDSSTINVECGSPSETRPRKTTCRMNQFAIVRPPTAVQIKDRMAEVDKRALSPDAKKDAASVCKMYGAGPPVGANVADMDVQFWTRLAQACAAKNEAAIWETLRWKIRDVDLELQAGAKRPAER